MQRNIKYFNYTYGLLFFLLGTLGLHIISSVTYAQEIHPIDHWTNACLNQNPSTAGMIRCLEQSYIRWDEELNRVYQALRNRLNADGQSVLKRSQKAWLVYRDAEFTTINMIYGSLQGTMWSLARVDSTVQIVKNRTRELQTYLKDLYEGEYAP